MRRCHLEAVLGERIGLSDAEWEIVDALLADKGYETDAIREDLSGDKVEVVIPAKASRRNRIGRLFNKLKNWRRVATRSDKTADSYIGFVSLALALLCLPFVHLGQCGNMPCRQHPAYMPLPLLVITPHR